ncbi:MAG: hypothetical protein E4H01_01755 [Lysobacterales bacterium]|nr:MAG: hypothetical protein E4H01_01755 [Xanthomonadales bacterium]
MADGLSDNHIALKSGQRRGVIPGIVAIALGFVALAIAAVEHLVFARISESAGGASNIFGLSFGTAAYIAGYAGAGLILIAIGIWKIYRA